MSDLYEALVGSSPLEAIREETGTSTTAAVYARTSSASQRFGYSIDEQVRQCVNRCEMVGWDVTFVFCDEAESGKDTNRPMFQRMLKVAEKGGFEVLVFWKLDRFSRSILHAVQLEKDFRDWNVALHSVTEQIDTTTAAGRFNFRNIANAAEFERELIKQRTKMGHTALAMAHKWPNSTPPLGYVRATDGTLDIDPAEAVLVRWIFQIYISRQSMPEVAQLLNERGRTTKTGNRWRTTAVSAVLRNRLYIGEYSVGEVKEDVPEYQILAHSFFEEVAAVRTRFKKPDSASRSSMDYKRKYSFVNRMKQMYSEFQNEKNV